MSRWQLVVVPHTHWDREWYRSHESFRYRLVRMLDGLIDLLEREPGFSHFTLDGQTVAVDDYLEVRPAARARIEALVRAGRLQVGPWFVLPDEWLVSGEALIRNLRRGLAEAESLGGAMPVGYVPDQFGHVGQLPQILAGFGLSSAVLWRGVGADVDSTLFSWEAADGTRLPTVWLLHGYGNGMHLPAAPEALAARLMGELRAQAPRSPVRCVLIMNGSDHLAPQPGLVAALAGARPLLEDAEVEIGTLPAYLERVRKELFANGAVLPVHRGELRSGLRAPILAGCASSRLRQKRADFLNDRLLTRYLEPLAAWWASLGGDPDLQAIDAAWRTALENHPHDSICGCSIDAVHDAMDTRFARVADWAGAHLAHVCAGLAREIAARTRRRSGGRGLEPARRAGRRSPRVCSSCRSTSREVGAAVALQARDAGGRARAGAGDGRDAGPALRPLRAARARARGGLLRGFPREFFGEPVCALSCADEAGRACVRRLARRDAAADFDFEAERRERPSRALDVARRCAGAASAAPAPRLRVQLPGDVPGRRPARAAPARVAQATPRAPPGFAASARRGRRWLENESWRIEVAPDGRVRLEHRPTGCASTTRCASSARPTAATPTPSTRCPAGARRASRTRVTLALAARLRGLAGIRIDARYACRASSRRIAARAAPSGVDAAGAHRARALRGVDRLEIRRVEVDNTACDHRLRLPLRAPFAAAALRGGVRLRAGRAPDRAGADAFGSAHPAEFPDGATPQRRFALLEAGDARVRARQPRLGRGRGAARGRRHRAGADALVRAVGWLSRDDLARRPGRAGPPLADAGRAVSGPPRGGAGAAARRVAATCAAAALRFADPPLLFAGGARAGSPARRRAPRRMGRPRAPALRARAARGGRHLAASAQRVGRSAKRTGALERSGRASRRSTCAVDRSATRLPVARAPARPAPLADRALRAG